MNSDHKKIIGAVNGSGFLFQLRVEEEIRSAHKRREHPWEVLVREYRWRDSLTQEDKYTDLVLSHGSIRMVIECKRLQDVSWVFLQPKDGLENQPVKLYWCHNQVDQPYLAGWDDFTLREPYPHSEFCIQQTAKGQRALVLENLASELLRSIEFLAAEDGATVRSQEGTELICLPVIVTTAPLYTVAFDAPDIDLAKGTINGGRTDLAKVPCVAFRKSLTTMTTTDLDMFRQRHGKIPNLALLNQSNARTAFVLDANYLTKFLSEIQVGRPNDWSRQWPWEIARRLSRDSTGMDFT